MSANAVVRARIDEHIKKEASVVLEAMGLTVNSLLVSWLIKLFKINKIQYTPVLS